MKTNDELIEEATLDIASITGIACEELPTVRGIIRTILTQKDAGVAEAVKYITETEPTPDTLTYLNLVKHGNKDDMYDYGIMLMRDMCIKALTPNPTEGTSDKSKLYEN